MIKSAKWSTFLLRFPSHWASRFSGKTAESCALQAKSEPKKTAIASNKTKHDEISRLDGVGNGVWSQVVPYATKVLLAYKVNVLQNCGSCVRYALYIKGRKVKRNQGERGREANDKLNHLKWVTAAPLLLPETKKMHTKCQRDTTQGKSAKMTSYTNTSSQLSYRVTIQVVSNLSLAPKQRLHFRINSSY